MYIHTRIGKNDSWPILVLILANYPNIIQLAHELPSFEVIGLLAFLAFLVTVNTIKLSSAQN